MSKSYSTIVQSMRDYIKAIYPSAQTHEGSVLDDIVIAVPSRELSQLYEKVDLVSEAQSIETATQDGLEKLGSNVNKFQKSAIPATGIVTFFSSTAPTFDITIPANTVVSTRGSAGVIPKKFRTLRKVVMYKVLAGSYLNSSNGKYEISAAIEALTPGQNGVVGARAVDAIQGSITGIEGVYNASATSGGEDFESEQDFAQRIAAAFTGNILGTEDGYLSEALAIDEITSATVVGHGNTGRDIMNAVDIYYKGSRMSTYTDIFTVPQGVLISEVVLTKQPVVVDTVTTLIYGNTGSIIGVSPAWSLVKDTGVYKGSIYGLDKIEFSGELVASLGTVYVTYSYNSLSEVLQNIFTKTNKDLLDISILVKEASAISIDIDLDVTVLAGFDTLLVASAIQDVVASFLDGLSIGQELQTADVAREVLNTPGVDDVLLPFTLFRASDGSILPNASNNLVIPSDSYATAGTITITTSI